jgi:hypothetical protein
VCEANTPSRWLAHAHRAVRSPEKGLEGAGYAAAFARHRIPYRLRTVVTRAHGGDRLEAVTTCRLDGEGAVIPGSERRIDCDLLALGWGFTPLLELPLSLGVATRVDRDGSLVCAVDAAGRTSVPGVFAAGETTGVGGAALAVAEGRRLGLVAAGRPVPAPIGRVIRRLDAFAHGMHAAYPVPPSWTEHLDDDTLVCRCEEVPLAAVRASHEDLAAEDPRSVKSFTRAGMGWCQGRECGFAVSCLTSLDPTAPGLVSLSSAGRRPLSTPVSLGALAALEGEDPR